MESTGEEGCGRKPPLLLSSLPSRTGCGVEKGLEGTWGHPGLSRGFSLAPTRKLARIQDQGPGASPVELFILGVGAVIS